MKKISANKIRPDLKATLNEAEEGTELVIERKSTPKAKTVISLKADEWHELVDWVRAISLLSNLK